MITWVKKLGCIDYTYEKLRINNKEIDDTFTMALVMKATGWFKNYSIMELQHLGYTLMYGKLIDEIEKRGLA